MWHEARKQEKKIRSLMVDYKKRADRRRVFYEKIKLDPAQFLRIYGRPAKIHWEQSVAMAAESPQSMMPWQGDSSIMIDRFDVRAHLDYIPETKYTEEDESSVSDEEEERNANYERYRILVQNECAAVAEEQCLQQIYTDEMYGGQDVKVKEKEKQEEKAKLAEKKVAIGYKYEEPENEEVTEEISDAESEESIDSDMDLDAVFDVDKLTNEQTQALNDNSVSYGMLGDDYIKCLWIDKDEAEELRLAKMMEEEKAQYSGRKSRRERRAYKEKKLRERGSLSPPSYAKRDSPKYEPYNKKPRSRSRSRSASPVVRTKKKFITSFGGSDDEAVVQGPALPPKHLLKTSGKSSTRKSKSPPMFKEIGPVVAKFKAISKKRSSSSSSRSPSPKYRGHSRRRSRSRSYSRSRYSRSHRSEWSSRRRSRSNSRSRTNSRRSRSPRSRPGRYRSMRSRSRSHRSRSRSRRSRSPRSRSRRSRSHKSVSEGSRSRSSSSLGSSRSRSKSPEKVAEVPIVFHRRSVTPSSSELSLSEEEDMSTPAKSASAQKDMGKLESSINKGRASMQQRMKKKMQKVLNQQYKADKRARLEKKEKEDLERLEREEELRLIAIDLRRKEREKRHQDQLEMDRMEQEERKNVEQKRKEREVKRSSDVKSGRSHSPKSSKKTFSRDKTETHRSKSPNRRPHGGDSRSRQPEVSHRSRSRDERRSTERGSKSRFSDSRSAGNVPKLVDY